MQLMVLGMHRSGTSMLTQLLHGMGLAVGDGDQLEIDPGGRENRDGFWERRDLRLMNEALLNSQDCEWDQILGWNAANLPPPAVQRFNLSAGKLVRELDALGDWVLKDPRLCLTAPLLMKHLAAPGVVLITRNPGHVAASLRTRNDFPSDVGLALWEAYMLAALGAARHCPSLLVRYESFVQQPQEAIAKLHADLGSQLGLRLPPVTDRCSRLIDRGLDRSSSVSLARPDGSHAAFALYRELHAEGIVALAERAPALSPESRESLARHERASKLVIYRAVQRVRRSLDAPGAGEGSAELATWLEHSLSSSEIQRHKLDALAYRDMCRQFAFSAELHRSSAMSSSLQMQQIIDTARHRTALAEDLLPSLRQLNRSLHLQLGHATEQASTSDQGRPTPAGSTIEASADPCRRLAAEVATAVEAGERVASSLSALREMERNTNDRLAQVDASLNAAARHLGIHFPHDPPQDLDDGPGGQRRRVLDRATGLAGGIASLIEALPAEISSDLASLGPRLEAAEARLRELKADNEQMRQQRQAEAERALRLQGEADRMQRALQRSGRLLQKLRMSWRWRLGDGMVRLAERLLRRPRVALALDELEEIAARHATAQAPAPHVTAASPLPIVAAECGLDDVDLRASGWASGALVLKLLQARRYPEWERSNAERASRGGTRRRPKSQLKVMIGTLHSGENEFTSCKSAIGRQDYAAVEHTVISGLPNREAHDRLYRGFLASRSDILIKIDADMVIVDEAFVSRVVRVFEASPELALLQMAILDFYSGGEIQGVNAYSKRMRWDRNRQDDLFTDMTPTEASARRLVWTTFARSVVHSPNPGAFQAFHFGVHRAVKVLRALESDPDRAAEQLLYLERTYQHYCVRRTRVLLLASIGAELAFRSDFSAADIDYASPTLREQFAGFDGCLDRDLSEQLELWRASGTGRSGLDDLRSKRQDIARRQRIGSMLLLLPHLKLFGGVNRFLEIARHARRQGIDAALGVLDLCDEGQDRVASDYPDVQVLSMSEAAGSHWDAVICGDFSSCLMATMPWMNSSLSVIYLLNGWQHRYLNELQTLMTLPDVVLANSRYAAEQYPSLAPTVVAGALDTDCFHAEGRVPAGSSDVFRVGIPLGRNKPRKRVEDALVACRTVRSKGLRLELHVIDAAPIRIELPADTVVHVGLGRREMSDLLRHLDVVICPEEDAGWNNPAAEAMACGAAVICTVAGTTDFAEHEQTALLVPARKPAAIASALRRLIDQPQLCRALAEAGAARARGFGWPALTRNLIDVLESARPDPSRRTALDARARRAVLNELGS